MGRVQRELGHGHGVRGGLAWLPMSLALASVTMALAGGLGPALASLLQYYFVPTHGHYRI
jgi:hypothetical protein